MSSSIFIPKIINVGYQNRKDTYTGKLAYIIYYDEKGKLRKEASWSRWRDEEIPNTKFNNVPVEGFVLNKKAGDYSSGWDHRKAYCRVYDPRGFEFEITIENLLYILQNTNSIKGKGLEGEFVYGWDGKDLVLMPIDSPDYKEIVEFSNIMNNGECIKAKDLIIGATYLTKDNEKWIYMGKFEAFDPWHRWENKGKHFWFYYNGRFEHYKSMPKNKFIKCIDDKCTEKYADIFYMLEGDRRYSPYDESKDEYKYFTFEEFDERKSTGYWWADQFIIKFKFISAYYGNENKYTFILQNKGNDLYVICKKEAYYTEVVDIFPIESKIVKSYYYPYKDIEEKHMIPVTLEEIFKVMKPMYIQTYLANGREYRREYEI